MAVLIGMSESVKGKTFQLDQEETTLGRYDDNRIVLNESGISSHHCRIMRQGNRYQFQDLHSTNGSTVNNVLVTEVYLKPKDIIRVGSVEMMLDGEDIEVTAESAGTATKVEVAAGPVAAPESFESVSPFGARRRPSRGLALMAILAAGVAAIVMAVIVLIKILSI